MTTIGAKVIELSDKADRMERQLDEILSFINELKGALSEVSTNPMLKMVGLPAMFADTPVELPQLPGMPQR